MTKRSDALRDRALSAAVPRESPMGRWGGGERWDGEAVVPAAGETFPFPPPSLPGTPTEDTWPGITSNEEFRAYNFTQYRAQPLINHAPR